MSTTIKNHINIDSFISNLQKLSDNHLVAKIGVLEKDGARKKQKFKRVGKQNIKVTSESITLAEVAMLNEFGMGNNPERSFIRSTFDENIKNWMSDFDNLLYAAMMNDRSFEGVLHTIADTIMSDIKKTIVRISTTEDNAKSTQKAKGFNSPLIATRELIRSINYEVVE